MARFPVSPRHLLLVAAAFSFTGAMVASCSSDPITADRTIVPEPASGASGAGGGASAGSSAAGAGGKAAGEGGAGATNSAGKAGSSGTSAGGGGEAGAGGRGELPTVCPAGGPGAKMVRIERGDGQAACIDEREVTQGEYHAFVEAVGIDGYRALGFCTEGGPTHLAYGWPEPNHADDDTHEYGTCDHGWYQPETTPTMAMGCVFSCQAASYCAWAGKELCGRFDSDEPLDETSAVDPKESVWAAACTNGGTTEQSQASKDPNVCGKKWDVGASGVVDALPDAHPECHGQGAYASVYSLGGGVGEFINGRTTATATSSSVPFAMGPSVARVGDDGATATAPCGRSVIGPPSWAVGFRCCQRLQGKP